MLSLRRLQVAALFGLAVLLFSAVTGYAEHISDEFPEWKDTWSQISTGDHSDTYSYHYFNVENNSNVSVWITWKWTHKLKQNGRTLASDAAESIKDSIKVRRDRSESRQGGLSANLAGGLRNEVYHIVSTTEIQLKNGNGFRSKWYKVSHTTRVDLEED